MQLPIVFVVIFITQTNAWLPKCCYFNMNTNLLFIYLNFMCGHDAQSLHVGAYTALAILQHMANCLFRHLFDHSLIEGDKERSY